MGTAIFIQASKVIYIYKSMKSFGIRNSYHDVWIAYIDLIFYYLCPIYDPIDTHEITNTGSIRNTIIPATTTITIILRRYRQRNTFIQSNWYCPWCRWRPQNRTYAWITSRTTIATNTYTITYTWQYIIIIRYREKYI